MFTGESKRISGGVRATNFAARPKRSPSAVQSVSGEMRRQSGLTACSLLDMDSDHVGDLMSI